MSMMEKAAEFLGEEFSVGSLWQIAGPLFVLCTVALAPSDPLVICVGIVGLLLSTRWQVRGLSYALVLLGIAAIVEHAFFTSRHLWILGLEGSYAIAFFITALSAEHRSSLMQSLNERLERRGASIQNLEDEIASLKESSTAQQIALQEKIGTLQREIEEVHSEHSSLLILNDVLRKTAAREGAERDAAKEELIDAQRRLSQALVEFERTEKELAHLSATDTIVAENRELKTQLNGARIEREQARLIGETLSRLHAKESFRAKEAEEKIAPLHEENEKLKRELLIFQREAENVSNQLEQMRGERERHRLAMQKLEEVQTDRNYLKERLEKAELELMRGGASPVNAEELAHLREKIASLSQIDALHRQLKSQFDEKNKVLHETRAQLFRADTQLQSLLIEKEQKELQHNPISEEIRRELSAMEEEIGRLEQENGELEDLVSTLTENPSESPPRRKKKVKTNPDQELLF